MCIITWNSLKYERLFWYIICQCGSITAIFIEQITSCTKGVLPKSPTYRVSSRGIGCTGRTCIFSRKYFAISSSAKRFRRLQKMRHVLRLWSVMVDHRAVNTTRILSFWKARNMRQLEPASEKRADPNSTSNATALHRLVDYHIYSHTKIIM